MGRKRKTTEEFILEYQGKFPEKNYDMSKFVYRGALKKGAVRCKKHGDFLARPSTLLQGSGCPHCSGNAKSNTEEFIAEYQGKFPEKGYGFEKFVYSGAHTKGMVICPIHGDFLASPNKLLQGNGCPKCRAEKRTSNTEEFIDKYRSKFPEKNYSFEKFVYVNTRTKVTIICPVHGRFDATPNNLLHGNGCPHCSGNAKSNTEEFIEKYQRKFPEKNYIFEKFVYSGAHTKGTVICNQHGEFEARPNPLLRGSGCPQCADSHAGSGLVYILATGSMVKIGKVKDNRQSNIDTRVRRIFKSQRNVDFPEGGFFALHGLYTFGDEQSFVEAGKAEKKAHKHFKNSHCADLPKFDGFSEFFTVSPEQAADYLISIGGVLAA